MMKKWIGGLAALGIVFGAAAQTPAPDGAIAKYRRSSLYTVLVKHSNTKYGPAIEEAFMAMPAPDKFNDHNLAAKAFESQAANKKKKKGGETHATTIGAEGFITDNEVAKQMVAKWFNRDRTGGFDMKLIQERGNYDASQADIRIAEQGALGRAILADAGEELIGKTFLLVNDITFVDKGEKSEKAKGWLKVLGQVAGAVTGSSDLANATSMVADGVGEIDGFTVNITSYLYRLDWNDEVAGHFYFDHWTEKESPDAGRVAAFDASDRYKLSYVGETSTSAGNLATKSFSNKSKEDQMLKVCTRAIDKSIVQLQRDYDEFKVNVPLYGINEDGTVDVQIGLKEGINSKSRFDVLMPVEGGDGRMTYEKVGRLQPVEGKIWDNRFGADEEAAAGEESKSDDGEAADATLTATTFRVLSGANRIMPGCLVREDTIKRQ